MPASVLKFSASFVSFQLHALPSVTAFPLPPCPSIRPSVRPSSVGAAAVRADSSAARERRLQGSIREAPQHEPQHWQRRGPTDSHEQPTFAAPWLFPLSQKSHRKRKRKKQGDCNEEQSMRSDQWECLCVFVWETLEGCFFFKLGALYNCDFH